MKDLLKRLSFIIFIFFVFLLTGLFGGEEEAKYPINGRLLSSFTITVDRNSLPRVWVVNTDEIQHHKYAEFLSQYETTIYPDLNAKITGMCENGETEVEFSAQGWWFYECFPRGSYLQISEEIYLEEGEIAGFKGENWYQFRLLEPSFP